MILDTFLEIIEEIQSLTNGTPCHPCNTQEQNLQRVDEVMLRLKGIDITKLCAELMDGVNSKKEMEFRLNLISSKIGTQEPFLSLPVDWHKALSNLFDEQMTKEIKDIMQEHTRAYILKWNCVFELWAFMSNEIEETISKMCELAEIKEPHPILKQKDVKLKNTRDKIESVFEELEKKRLIKRCGENYEWLSTPILLDFLLGVLLCGDEVYKDKYSNSIWEIKGTMPLDAVKTLFPNSTNIGKQRRNKNNTHRKGEAFTPKGYEMIYDIARGY